MKRQTFLRWTMVCTGLVLLSVSSAAAQGLPCTQCGPGPHWVDACAGGQDQIGNQSAVVGIDLSFDCVADVSLVMPPCSPTTPLTISRSAPRDDSVNFPGLRAVDGHLDVIDTEILSMCNLNGGVVLKVGPSQVPILRRSLGAVAEDPGNSSLASSFFDVFFEVDLGGGQKAYNLDPLRLQGVISCAPPRATYIHPTGCIPLYSDPDPAPPNVHVANLVSAIHSVNVEKVPTVSQWGLIAMALLFVMAATIGLIRRRTAPWQSGPTGGETT